MGPEKKVKFIMVFNFDNTLQGVFFVYVHIFTVRTFQKISLYFTYLPLPLSKSPSWDILAFAKIFCKIFAKIIPFHKGLG